MGNYFLRCNNCGRDHQDDGLRTVCDGCKVPSLLRTIYAVKRFRPEPGGSDILRYRHWLPATWQPRSLPPAARHAWRADCSPQSARVPGIQLRRERRCAQRNGPFEALEGIDIEPAAAVVIAGL